MCANNDIGLKKLKGTKIIFIKMLLIIMREELIALKNNETSFELD